MELEGRELKIRMKGEDVALLQQELTQLSYQILHEVRQVTLARY